VSLASFRARGQGAKREEETRSISLLSPERRGASGGQVSQEKKGRRRGRYSVKSKRGQQVYQFSLTEGRGAKQKGIPRGKSGRSSGRKRKRKFEGKGEKFDEKVRAKKSSSHRRSLTLAQVQEKTRRKRGGAPEKGEGVLQKTANEQEDHLLQFVACRIKEKEEKGFLLRRGDYGKKEKITLISYTHRRGQVANTFKATSSVHSRSYEEGSKGTSFPAGAQKKKGEGEVKRKKNRSDLAPPPHAQRKQQQQLIIMKKATQHNKRRSVIKIWGKGAVCQLNRLGGERNGFLS